MPKFSELKREQHIKLSSRGGKAAARKNVAHKFTKEQARAAANKRWNKDK